MEMQATANGRNPYFEGQHPAEDAEDTANRLALVAERDALRECVKAADDVKGRDEFNHESEWASYDAARAKVKL